MIEIVLVFGIVIAAGLAILLRQAPSWLRRHVLRHHFFYGVVFSVLVLWLHWGTMTGLMSATVAGLTWSVVTQLWRKREFA